MKKSKLFKSGITVRWLLTTILVIALILSLFAALITFAVRGYYYNAAEQKLQSLGQSATLADFFSSYIGASNEDFAERAKEYIESFSEINTAEVWVYNREGDVIVTSTGFDARPDENTDYFIASENDSGRGMWTGNLASGEKIMALTVMLPKSMGESNGAVRYIISLEDIDNQISTIALYIGLACFAALLLVIVSGLFFVRSIVVPVKKINVAARKIAEGNYKDKLRVTNHYDELSELSESINYMTDEIEKTDRLKNDFISTVSHELRTPLTAIKGWTETLIDINPDNDPTTSEGLKIILKESERLYSMVEDLLDFSRMQNGTMSFRFSKIDILAELDEAVFVLRDRAEREGLKIFYSAPDYPAPMNADPDRIKQVFVNILDNAIKYTPSGGSINVVAALTSKSLKVSISDTGCGIEAKDLPNVKKKFYKANKSVKGSGIGLAVCDEIVSRHNGTLDIQSKPGEGTTVTIELPTSSVNLSGGKEKQ